MINQLKNPNKINSFSNKDRIEVVFYTDPLCCWSLAILPEITKLQNQYGSLINLSYCMGGLIKDWNSFTDPLNNVSKPSQMGPVWMDASLKMGMDINYSMWVENPPSSSYPACIAVKTAALQSKEAEASYFKYIAEAALMRGKNISKPEVLVEVAEQLFEEKSEIFDLHHFLKNYNNETSRDAFRHDLQKVKSNNIGRFPTVTMAFNNKKLLLTGYHPFDTLADAFLNITSCAFKVNNPYGL